MGREYVIGKALERKGISDHTTSSCGEYGITELMIKAGLQKIQVLSTLPHSSIAKAAGIVGIGRRNIIPIAADYDPLQIDLARLEDALNHYARLGWTAKAMSIPHFKGYSGAMEEMIVVLLERCHETS